MRKVYIPLLYSGLVCMFLSACGGSGGPPAASEDVESTVLQGVAASGNPLSGRLTIRDCSFPNRSTSVSINQDGTYSTSVIGLTPPYFIRVAGITVSGAPLTLYSFASSPGTVNVNPLTNLLVAAAAGVPDKAGLTELYANHDLSSGQSLANALPGTISALQTAIQPFSTIYGITALDPFTYPYQMNHQGLDGLFDDMGVDFSKGTMTLSNVNTGASFYSALLGNMGNGALQSASLPAPTQYPMPGNARLTMVLSGLPSSGTPAKHLKTTIQLPLGVTVTTDSTGVSAVANTAIPSGNGVGAIVYPSPALSSTDSQLTIELSSLNGIGAGEFLTLRCVVSFAQLSLVKATDFTAIQTLAYGDIYKQQRLNGATVTLTNLVFPVTEGSTIYNSLCAGCHTLSTVDTVGMPSLLNKAGLIPATFATVHHNTSLTQQQIEDLQAFLTAQSLN
ncbi:MAG: hypothetical protein ABSA86_06235 [Oryzomonas sp.]|jgi:hypothetical protein